MGVSNTKENIVRLTRGLGREGGSKSVDNLDRQILLTVVERVAEETLEMAKCYVLANKVETGLPPEFEDEFREVLKKNTRYRDLPEHKVRWFMDMADLIFKAMSIEVEREFNLPELRLLVSFSGIYEREFEDVRARKEYDKKTNWKDFGKGYQDQDDIRYVGPLWARESLTEHRRFHESDVDGLMGVLNYAGLVDRGNGFTYRAAGNFGD